MAGDIGMVVPSMGRLESVVLRGLAFGLGGAGLVLDFTGWYTIVGGVFGLLGVAFALLTPRGSARRTALWLNGVTVMVAVAILATFFI